MRIHEIIIENFRALEHLELRDIPDRGVIVIHGDNEQGKSSILEAINLLLSTKSTSRSGKIKVTQPVDRDVPVSITLEATVGTVRFRILKRYLKTPATELQIMEPRPSNHRGEDAETKFAEVLESHLDTTLLDTLFMKQGEVQAGINAVGIPALTSALNAQNGNTEDAAEDTELMAAVEKEYAKFYTTTGKANSRFAQFTKQVDGLRADLDDASAEVAKLSSHVDRVSRLERDRDQAHTKLPQAEEELASRRFELDAALKVKTEAEEVRAQFARAREQLEHAEATQHQRGELQRRVESAHHTVEQAVVGQKTAQEAADREEEELQILTERLKATRRSETTAIETVKQARQAVASIKNRERKDDLTALLAELEGIGENLHALRTAQSTLARVTQRDIDALQKASTEVDIQKKLVETRQGSITLSASVPTDIRVGEESISASADEESFSLDRELSIVIGDVTLVINPGKTAAESRTDLESAEAALAELLDHLDVVDIEQLRERFNTQEKRAADIAALLKEEQRISGGTEIAVLRAELDGLQIAEEFDPDLSLEDAQVALDEAEDLREQAGEAQKLAAAALDGVSARPADTALTILNARLGELNSNVVAAQTELDAALAETSTEDIDALVLQRVEALAAVALQKKQVEEALAQTNPDMAARLHDAAEANLKSYKSAISEANTELVRLEGLIGVAAGAKERFDKVQAALKGAENRLESEQRRAHAARRLHELMVFYRDESRKRYAAPFADKLSRLAASVFGENTDFDLDDQLSIASRSIGPRTVDIDHLSGGAQEQLAILTRFAIAELVAESSAQGAVPVFIDDALGSTDPERLTRISTLFSDAGKESQVFVLTCVPDRYNYVEVTQKRSIESLKTTNVLL
ncbi:AAA family ATPase [Corynebacterium crudilactis]|uniref:DNA repair protein n=1 Tax=Corynebacterium crudilactis TaxID=1652495 RepID=A0A172QSR2_9CORY|nr:AAA family ATPase [Corynebacterium crudilactis]ANE03737.1 DNA repair protein [Corynebacterium crudilactis]